MTSEDAIRKGRAIIRSKLRGALLKFFEFPSQSISVSELETHLMNLEQYEDFIPDVIVTDYADKFTADDKRLDYRNQLNAIWEAHKALAQKRHCLVITASQSNTARTEKNIRQGDWADDIRKLALVDGAIALNQSAEEKRDGVMRWTVIAKRLDAFDTMQEVVVLQQLKIGRPYLDSWRK